MALELPYGYKNLNPEGSSNADEAYGYYDSLGDAYIAVPLAMRKGGRTVGIKQGDGSIVEYWWENDNDLSDSGLVVKYAVQKTPHFSLTGNITLDPTHNDGFVFWAGGVLTIDPNTKTYQEKFNCIVKNRPQTDSSIVLVAKTGVQYYVEGKAVANSGTYIFWGGGSISVVKEEGTQNYYIKGNVQ